MLREFPTHHDLEVASLHAGSRSDVQQRSAGCCLPAKRPHLFAATGKPSIAYWFQVAAHMARKASIALLAMTPSLVRWPVQTGGPTQPQAGPSKCPSALPPSGQVMQQAMTDQTSQVTLRKWLAAAHTAAPLLASPCTPMAMMPTSWIRASP